MLFSYVLIYIAIESLNKLHDIDGLSLALMLYLFRLLQINLLLSFIKYCTYNYNAALMNISSYYICMIYTD